MTGPSRRADPKSPARPPLRTERTTALPSRTHRFAVLDAADRIVAISGVGPGTSWLPCRVGRRSFVLASLRAEFAVHAAAIAVCRHVVLDVADRIMSAVVRARFANRAVAVAMRQPAVLVAAGQGLAGRSGRVVVLA
jgi:hypothetical protein